MPDKSTNMHPLQWMKDHLGDGSGLFPHANPNIDLQNDIVAPVQKAKAFYDKLTAQVPHGTKYTGHPLIDEPLTSLGNFGSGVIGIASPLVHPLKTIQSFEPNNTPLERGLSAISPAAIPLLHAAKAFRQHPIESTEQGLGGLAGTALLGEAATMPDAPPPPNRTGFTNYFNDVLDAKPKPVDLGPKTTFEPVSVTHTSLDPPPLVPAKEMIPRYKSDLPEAHDAQYSDMFGLTASPEKTFRWNKDADWQSGARPQSDFTAEGHDRSPEAMAAWQVELPDDEKEK